MYKGNLIKHSLHSDFYLGTVRDYWLYIPAGYTADTCANLMVFQDGFYYIDETKPMQVPIVIEQLIAENLIPQTICIFINPGIFEVPSKAEHHPDTQRSLEYDAMNDQYTRFLLNELLPQALDGLNVSNSPEDRAIVGFSSGGICAWSVAWHRPDMFGKVLSHCGSFVDIRGGGNFPYLIRNEIVKPIKMYFQSGENDLDTKYGNWALGNKQMAAALKFKGYDYHFEFGEQGHNLIHGAELLADSIKWLFSKSIK
ncbi:alpha/beta hydrolase [Pseudoalteromonas denitrificans]|uniref:Enterochelin esterase n=1 Tax=Pseudoalteromonas denitrificans DSM 6059 TaxID=1123010 RepID=A0A1I1NBQ3_9GAMM|nr:alpha/beta hydrolase-fold protein [Pseudoalteromonas denitrificans]SFC94682.1 enterochelin esterase [Pseudoalteromonas denitrificans DSM 6059]